MRKLTELTTSELKEVNGGSVKSGFDSLFSGLSSLFTSIINRDKDAISKSHNDIVDAAKEIHKSFWDGIWS